MTFEEWWNKYWLAPTQAVLQVEPWKSDFREAYRAGQREMRERAAASAAASSRSAPEYASTVISNLSLEGDHGQLESALEETNEAE